MVRSGNLARRRARSIGLMPGSLEHSYSRVRSVKSGRIPIDRSNRAVLYRSQANTFAIPPIDIPRRLLPRIPNLDGAANNRPRPKVPVFRKHVRIETGLVNGLRKAPVLAGAILDPNRAPCLE